MKNAGREIEDDALAEAMKQTGLGTPATRAEIIEKLIRTAYVERERKQLRASEKGRALIALVAEPLRSPELTAAWEQQLKEVEAGRRAGEAFYGLRRHRRFRPGAHPPGRPGSGALPGAGRRGQGEPGRAQETGRETRQREARGPGRLSLVQGGGDRRDREGLRLQPLPGRLRLHHLEAGGVRVSSADTGPDRL